MKSEELARMLSGLRGKLLRADKPTEKVRLALDSRLSALVCFGSRLLTLRSRLFWLSTGDVCAQLDHRLFAAAPLPGDPGGGGCARRSGRCRCATWTSTPSPTPRRCRCRSTPSPRRSVPEEVERQITFPIEQVISGLPGLQQLRSVSKFGLSQVVVTFDDGTDIYFARQVINERLGTVELPPGIERPKMGPVATGLGEVFHYVVNRRGRSNLTELRTDPRLDHQARSCARCRARPRSTRWGGYEKQYQVRIDPDRLHQARPDLRPGGRGRRAEQPQRRRRQHPPEQPDAPGPRPGPHGQRRADREHRRHGPGRRADPRPRRGRRARSATRSAAAPSPPTARAKWCSAWASCSWARTATTSPGA